MVERIGYIHLDKTFKVGSKLLAEMKTVFPFKILKRLAISTLIIHGNKNTYVSYNISKYYSKMNPYIDFITVDNSEYGFGCLQKRKYVIDTVIEWLSKKG